MDNGWYWQMHGGWKRWQTKSDWDFTIYNWELFPFFVSSVGYGLISDLDIESEGLRYVPYQHNFLISLFSFIPLSGRSNFCTTLPLRLRLVFIHFIWQENYMYFNLHEMICCRMLGEMRFPIWSVWRVMNLRVYKWETFATHFSSSIVYF